MMESKMETRSGKRVTKQTELISDVGAECDTLSFPINPDVPREGATFMLTSEYQSLNSVKPKRIELMDKTDDVHYMVGDEQSPNTNRNRSDTSIMREELTDAVGSIVNNAMREMTVLFSDTLREVYTGIKGLSDALTQRQILQTVRSYEENHPRQPQMSLSRNKPGVSRMNNSRSHSNPLLIQNETTSSSDESENSENVNHVQSRRVRSDREAGVTYGPKLPPYTGKEEWRVWINRFNDVALRRGWNNDDKIDQILPKLQGQAGEFVFGQLSPEIRGNFSSLVKELEHRFQRIETAKTYSAKFSKRNQKPGESFEDYAAELKKLYDKAHADRDSKTRNEDLLRRFLDGLLDDKVRIQVEYVKDPTNIDEAVYEVVNLVETKRSVHNDVSDKRVRTRIVHGFISDDDSEEERAARLPTRSFKQNGDKVDSEKAKQDKSNDPCLSTEIKAVKEGLNEVTSVMKSLVDKMAHAPVNTKSRNDIQPTVRNKTVNRKVVCYRCGKPGHYANECKTIITGQIQVTTQPNPEVVTEITHNDVPVNANPNE